MSNNKNLTGITNRSTGSLMVYIGSYSAKTSSGIHVYRFDETAGKLAFVETINGLKDPSFIKINARQNMLYTFSQAENGEEYSMAVAYRIDASTGKLSWAGQQETAAMTGTYINMDQAGRVLMLVSYGTGILSMLPLSEKGEIGPLSQKIRHSGSGAIPERQNSAHPHSIYPDPSDQFVIVPDLGMDKVMVYRLNRIGIRLDLHDKVMTAPGAGPRHFAFHPVQPYAYLIEELSSHITVFHFDQTVGKLLAIQSISTLPEEYDGTNICAEVQVSPDGRFVYGSNRGHDSITVFSVNSSSGELSFVEHTSTLGKHPRNFCVTPDGNHLFVANKDSNSVHVMKVDKDTGKLQSSSLNLEIAQPSCVCFFPLD